MTEHEKLVVLIKQAREYIRHLESKIQELQENTSLKPGSWLGLWRILKTSPLQRDRP